MNNISDQIRKRMEAKTNEELQRIYEEHNESEWSEDAFDAIRQILTERSALPSHSSSTGTASTGIAERALRRYRDAYLLASATTGVGAAVKFVGFLIGGGIVIISFIIASKADNMLYILGGIIAGAVIVVPLWVLGVLVSALGQVLKASLDDAVHTSPFLDDSARARAMSLE